MKNKELAVLILGTLLATVLGLSYNYYSEYKNDRHDVEIVLDQIDSIVYSIEYHIDTLDNFKRISDKFNSIKSKSYNNAFNQVIEGNKYNAIIRSQELLIDKINNAHIECELMKNQLMYYYTIKREKERLSRSLNRIEQINIKQNIILENLVKEKTHKLMTNNY